MTDAAATGLPMVASGGTQLANNAKSTRLVSLKGRWVNGKIMARSLPHMLWRMVSLSLKPNGDPADPALLSRYSGIFRRSEVDLMRPTLERVRAFDPHLLWATEFLGGGQAFQKAWEIGLICTYAHDLSGQDVLDIGSGNSTFPVFLKARCGANAVSFDLPIPNALPLWWSQRQYKKWNVRRDIGDMLALPYESGSWDLVTCISVIEHLNWELNDASWLTVTGKVFLERTRIALSEMCRVCKQGGLVYITSDVLIKAIEEQPEEPRVTTGYSLEEVENVWLPVFDQFDMEVVQPEPFSEEILQESRNTGGEVPPGHKRPFAFLLRKR